jgi:hypothetical protein
MELDEKIMKIDEKIAEIDRKLEKLNAKEKEDKTPIGLISLINGYINIELLLDEKLFDEEKMNKLQDITNKLQELLLEIQNENN